MHFGPWEIAAFVGLWTGAFMLAADVGLRVAPNIRTKLPKLEKIQDSGWWAFTPLILLTISGAIFLANALGMLPAKQNVDVSWSWQFLAPLGLLALVLSIWAVRRKPPQRQPEGLVDGGHGEAGTSPNLPRGTPENVRQLDRTAFLVTTALVDRIYLQELWRALKTLPSNPDDMPIDTDEKLKRETGRLNQYFSDVAAKLCGSQWAAEFDSVIKNAEVEADSELLRNDAPAGLHSQRYRLFYIARMCRDRTQGFLEKSIVEAEQQEKNMLQMLRDRPDIHKFPRKS